MGKKLKFQICLLKNSFQSIIRELMKNCIEDIILITLVFPISVSYIKVLKTCFRIRAQIICVLFALLHVFKW